MTLKPNQVHALKSAHRMKVNETEKTNKAQAWSSFNSKGKKLKGEYIYDLVFML